MQVECPKRVIEIGSYDVNGEIRSMFAGVSLDEYVGVDLVEGPGVDVVSLGHEVQLDASSFDLAISVECFEHDQFWPQTFARMIELVRPGGWIVFSCASKGRPEHGTRRSDPRLSPGTSRLGFDYYKNLCEIDFYRKIDLNRHFSEYQFLANERVFDLYFIGRRREDDEVGRSEVLITEDEFREIVGLTPMSHRIIREPLRILSNILPESRYQEFAFRYWKFLNEVQERYAQGRFSRS